MSEWVEVVLEMHGSTFLRRYTCTKERVRGGGVGGVGGDRARTAGGCGGCLAGQVLTAADAYKLNSYHFFRVLDLR